MAQRPANSRLELREEAKAYYRDKKNIENKWLDQYGNISLEDDYQRNRSCLSEVFNMLDVVMENCIEDFRKSHVLISAEPIGPRTVQYTFEGDNGKTVEFRTPSVFAGRATALRAIGYKITDELFYDTRLLRNETTHGNKTIILQHMQLSYEDTKKAMLSMADTLIELGMLDPSLRTPPFERLRVHENDTLANGAYTIESMIGEGGMSRVYKATQKRVGREIAIKELKPDTYSDELIRHECEILLRLHHEQIPQIHDVFYENSTWYIVMSYVEGATLDRYIAEHSAGKTPGPGPVPNSENQNGSSLQDVARLSISRTLLDILAYLHSPEVGIVFADLAPDNIIIDSTDRPHLIDFGISGNLETRQALPAATRGYSAPEVFAGSILDQRADIYSFGYILRFLFTGLSPLEEPETPTDELVGNKKIAAVINRCTAKNPEERYADIAELTTALFPETAISGVSRSRRRIFIAAFAAAAVCAAGIGAWQYTRQQQELSEAAAPAGTESNTPLFPESGLTDHVMEWDDAALEQAMREKTGITEGAIRLSDVWHLQQLSLADAGISDVSSLGELTNLNSLNLSGNELENADALASLTGLRDLTLADNQLSDLSFLRDLTSLETLDLDHNRISDLTPLAELPALSALRLQRNAVKDITPLAEIPNLQTLYVAENSLNSDALFILSGMTGLSVLDLSFCGVQSLVGLETLSQLNELYLDGNAVTDITPLKELSSLTTLDLQNDPLGNDPSVLAALSGLTGLTKLDLMNTGVSDLTPLSGLRELSQVDLSHNNIADLSALHELTDLQYLDISSNQISDLEPLSSLTDLGSLYASDNTLSGDLSALEQLTGLTLLDLRNNRISDISALAGMTGLRELHIENNEITDFSPLDELHITELTK